MLFILKGGEEVKRKTIKESLWNEYRKTDEKSK